LADSQRASEERRAQASQAINQAELVATFMKSLLSSDAVEKELAIRAVLLALPESGPQLVAAVRTGSGDQKTRAAAGAALDARKDQLVQDIYASDDSVRKQASEQLTLGFRNDPSLVDTLVREAQRQSSNAAGVYNSAMVLQAMPAAQLQAKQNAVAQFTEIASTHDP